MSVEDDFDKPWENWRGEDTPETDYDLEEGMPEISQCEGNWEVIGVVYPKRVDSSRCPASMNFIARNQEGQERAFKAAIKGGGLRGLPRLLSEIEAIEYQDQHVPFGHIYRRVKEGMEVSIDLSAEGVFRDNRGRTYITNYHRVNKTHKFYLDLEKNK